MNIIARLIQVIQWTTFIWLLLMIAFGLISYNIDGYVDYENSVGAEGFFWAVSYILLPFIRYIIFGRIGWFPWTAFRKE